MKINFPQVKQKFQRYKLAETKVPAYNPDRSTL